MRNVAHRHERRPRTFLAVETQCMAIRYFTSPSELTRDHPAFRRNLTVHDAQKRLQFRRDIRSPGATTLPPFPSPVNALQNGPERSKARLHLARRSELGRGGLTRRASGLISDGT